MILLRRWVLLCALVFVGVSHAAVQIGGAAPASMVVGVIKAANVRGDVRKVGLSDRSESTLRNGDTLRQDQAVVTRGAGSSVVLVFANGATVRVGSDSRLEIREFLMDPLQADMASVAALVNEPTTSRTDLRLEFGEMVGNVKTLNRAAGSTFSVGTPAGAAGIRGTTFRIVYRPTGDGLAFQYQLNTSEGVVVYEGVLQGSGGVSVSAGQEIVVLAQVDPATNSIVVGAPSAPAGTALSSEAATALQNATVEIVQSQQQTSFTQVELQAPPAPPPPPAAPRTTPGDGR